MRIPHKLKPNKNVEIPHHFITFDTETYPSERVDRWIYHKLRLGWACYTRLKKPFTDIENEWCYFETPSQFWDFVETHAYSKTRLWVLAHNIQFDFPAVDGFRELARRGWDMVSAIFDSNRFIFKWRKGDRTIQAIDTLQLFPFSLRRLGEFIGKPKLDVNPLTASKEELLIYCRRDVEILRDVFIRWVRFIRRHNLGSFKPTLAAQSFNAFRHRFMKHPIYIHNDEEALKLERMSYRGGRSECFYIGEIKEPLFDLDINSMYPFVMKTYSYPTALLRRRLNVSPHVVRKALERYSVIAFCRIKIDKPAIGVKAHKLIFPIGEFNAYLTTPELEWVFENGEVIDVYEAVFYRRHRIFKGFVETIYSLRKRYKKRGNVVGSTLCKLLLNSLYGKFGQKAYEIQVLGEAHPDNIEVMEIIDAETRERYIQRIFGGKNVIEIRTLRESFDSFPAIASHITAYARMLLWRYIEEAGLDNVYYCDTDSLFVNQRGYNRLISHIDEYELGKLKIERVAGSGYIFAPKDYILGEVVKRKGIKPSDEQIDENTFKSWRFARIRTLMRLGHLSSPVQEIIVKRLNRIYDKGVILENGRVRPFVVGVDIDEPYPLTPKPM